MTQNQASHFGGNYEIGSTFHSELKFVDTSRDDVQIVSAVETNAYPGTDLQRTMAMIKLDASAKPFIVDIMRIDSATKNQYDLPYYFMGQVLETSFDYEAPTVLAALGEENGYQHLYLEAKGKPASESSQFTWLQEGKFYTLTAATALADDLIFARIGANDPDFNLRRDAALIIRRADTQSTVIAAVIEPHGSYSPISELSVDPKSSVAHVSVVHDDAKYTAVRIEDRQQQSSLLVVANSEAVPSKKHKLKVDGQVYRWTGPYHFVEKL